MTTNLPAIITVSEIKVMADAIAKSGLFGVKTPEQAMALMLIAQAEGLHPAIAARDYDIIQGRPAKKSEAMLRSFLQMGGKVEWHELSDTKASATFSHPQGGTLMIDWDMARASKAGLATKDMFKKFPRQMLRARVISEGVRTIHPGATSGMYTPEEVQEFEPRPTRPARLPKPEEAKPEEPTPIEGEAVKDMPESDYNAQEKTLRDAASLPALAMAWNKLDMEAREALAQVRDDCRLAIIEAERVAAE